MNLSNIKALKKKVIKTINITNLGDIFFFLGIQVIQDYKKGAIYINQTKFIKELID